MMRIRVRRHLVRDEEVEVHFPLYIQYTREDETLTTRTFIRIDADGAHYRIEKVEGMATTGYSIAVGTMRLEHDLGVYLGQDAYGYAEWTRIDASTFNKERAAMVRYANAMPGA
jgi:hypothetical protein